MEKGYRNLITWRKADELAYRIYQETKKFPKDELYGITSQLRRAAIPCQLILLRDSVDKEGMN